MVVHCNKACDERLIMYAKIAASGFWVIFGQFETVWKFAKCAAAHCRTNAQLPDNRTPLAMIQPLMHGPS